MEQKKKRMFDYFKKHGGIARFSSIIKAGFHSDTLHPSPNCNGTEFDKN